MVHVYILYSPQIDRFYIGQTIDLTQRLDKHNNGFYSGTYTRRTSDWEIFYQIECETREQAILVEKHIKKMKSRKYLEDLKKFPEITAQLLLLYS